MTGLSPAAAQLYIAVHGVRPDYFVADGEESGVNLLELVVALMNPRPTRWQWPG